MARGVGVFRDPRVMDLPGQPQEGPGQGAGSLGVLVWSPTSTVYPWALLEDLASEGWIWAPPPAIPSWGSLGTCRGALLPQHITTWHQLQYMWEKRVSVMGLQWQGLQTHSNLFMRNTTFTLFSPKLSSLWSEVRLAAFSLLLQLSQAQL